MRIRPGPASTMRSLEALHRVVAAVSCRHVPLPGSPKRELREYSSIHRKPIPIPSAHASGFQGTRRPDEQRRRPVAAVSDRGIRPVTPRPACASLKASATEAPTRVASGDAALPTSRPWRTPPGMRIRPGPASTMRSLEALHRVVAAVSCRHVPLPGSPKRELREYASIHRKPIPIPSAHASGFQGTRRPDEQRRPVAAVSDRRIRPVTPRPACASLKASATQAPTRVASGDAALPTSRPGRCPATSHRQRTAWGCGRHRRRRACARDRAR